MEWFNGTVDEALKKYQEKNGILIVYICDQNNVDGSTLNFNALWATLNQDILNAIPYVALKLDRNSNGAAQFSQFFPTPVFPVCYIIGLGGQPLEVITTVEELTMERLNNSILKSLELYKSQIAEKNKPVNSSPTTKETETMIQEHAEGSSLPMEDRVKHVRKLLEEKRKKDEENKKAEDREKELHRRNEGKMLAELKEKTKDKELKELAEARRRQKQEDQMALKKLRDQIQRDKEERARKNQPTSANEETISDVSMPAQIKPVPVSIKCDECRIQCKFPDGSNLIKTFPPNAQLQAVMDAINEDPRKPISFILVQVYPRQPLDDPLKTLEELGLTPSSALLVVPGFSNSNQKRDLLARGSYVNILVGFLYMPFAAIFNFIMGIFNLTSRQPHSKPVEGSELDVGSTTANSRIRKDGAMNRLKTDDDSSDEGATWNGNSTQQL